MSSKSEEEAWADLQVIFKEHLRASRSNMFTKLEKDIEDIEKRYNLSKIFDRAVSFEARTKAANPFNFRKE